MFFVLDIILVHGGKTDGDVIRRTVPLALVVKRLSIPALGNRVSTNWNNTSRKPSFSVPLLYLGAPGPNLPLQKTDCPSNHPFVEHSRSSRSSFGGVKRLETSQEKARSDWLLDGPTTFLP
jgi:hypothetical protein